MTSESSNRRNENRLKIALRILNEYRCDLPLHTFLRKVFQSNKSFGAADRRLYRQLLYGYYRTGRLFQGIDVEQRMAIGAWITDPESEFSKYLIGQFAPRLATVNSKTDEVLPVWEMLVQQYSEATIEKLLPDGGTISTGIDIQKLAAQVLEQPAAWVRVNDQVKFASAMEEQKLDYRKDPVLPNAFAFAQGIDLTIIEAYKAGVFEIQDRSSQIAGNMIPVAPGSTWWDCCSGAGGKALQVAARMPEADLICTDKRPAIIENLKVRIARNRCMNIREAFVLDLLDAAPGQKFDEPFDGIIADVPCSGSGTWSRTPEMISCNREGPGHYPELQKAILHKVWPMLKPGGQLVYITCSVFSEENERIIEYFTNKPGVTPVMQTVIQGSDYKSDTMFVAVLKKS